MSVITLEIISPNFWITCRNKQTNKRVQVCCERQTQVEFAFENIHQALGRLGEVAFYRIARQIRDKHLQEMRDKYVKAGNQELLEGCVNERPCGP